MGVFTKKKSKNTNNMERFNEIDIVKGIAMLTVLWHHSFILYPIYMLDIPWCQHAMDINGTFFIIAPSLVNKIGFVSPERLYEAPTFVRPLRM